MSDNCFQGLKEIINVGDCSREVCPLVGKAMNESSIG